MMRYLTAMIALTLSVSVHAKCANDYSTTLEANKPKPNFIPCRNAASGKNCRELNEHPKDFRNAMRNYMTHGGGLNAEQNVSRFQKQSQYARTFCNDHGQCATAIMTTHFDTFDVSLSAGVISTKLTLRDALDEGAIRSFDITVQMPDDTPYRTNGYSANMLEKSSPMASIPADSRPDSAKTGECLDNNGDKVKKTNQNTGRYGWYVSPRPNYGRSRIVGGTRGSAVTICGTSRISDGPSRTTCMRQ